MIDQLSIYLENEKGATLRVLSLLAQSGINVLGLSHKDDSEFGTLRLILSDPQLGKQVLEDAGYLCHAGHVIGVELDDTPGALERMLENIEDMNINIDYLYVGYARENNMPIIMIHCDYVETVQDTLRRRGYNVH